MEHVLREIEVHIVITIPKQLCDLYNFHPRDYLLIEQIDIDEF